MSLAVQYPMFTLPIPPENPLMWNEPPEGPEPDEPVPPQILSGGADPSTGGGACDFTCATDVPCSGHLDYGADTTYGTSVPAASGDGTTGNVMRWTVSGLTPAAVYHFRFRVTGLAPPNDIEAIGIDQTFTAE